MAVEVVMPKLGMAMEEGVVSVWNKEVGDSIKKGEPIASVNSEKIEIDVESPTEGTLLRITVPEGEGVPPGTVIAYVGNPDEKVIFSSMEMTDINVVPEEIIETSTPINEQIDSPKSRIERVKISPVARKMAIAANLDIETIKGSGPGGRITREDVQEAIRNLQIEKPVMKVMEKENSVKLQPAEESKSIPLIGMRKVIAGRMYNSLQKSAQLTITMKVDVTEIISLQKQTADSLLARYDTKLSLTDYIARAVVLSLKQVPEMNSAYINDTIYLYNHIHLGIAVALEKGLVVPVIRAADNSSLIELSKAIKLLAQKARDGQLTNDDMQGSTFTITSLGTYDIEFFTPILNPPETGILGVGKAIDTPVYRNDKLDRRSILPLSLTFDHRVIDGAPAASFLQMIKQYLEAPFTMLV